MGLISFNQKHTFDPILNIFQTDSFPEIDVSRILFAFLQILNE